MFDKIAEKEDIMKYVVDTHGLTKIFGKHRAVDCVSLHIKRGEIYGFIGKNGAGKTTFMKMVSGLSAPTSGEIALFGVSGREAEKYHSRIGNLIEQPGLYEGMSAKENLHLKCLAMALAGRPDLLILDEPVNGLDPQGIAEIRDLLLKLKFEKNMTILISSHILEELYKVADTFGVIHKGVLIQELSKEELDQKCRDYTEIKTGDTEKACPVIEELGYHNYKVITADCIHLYDRVEEIGKLNMELAKQGCMVESLQVVQDKLEEYFLELTRD